MRVHVGYALAAIGYMVGIFMQVDVAQEGGVAVPLTAVVELPLFMGLAACTLLCLTDGEWRRDVSWRLYAFVVAFSGGYAALSEWYAMASGRATSLFGFFVSTAGVVGLLVAHRFARRREVA